MKLKELDLKIESDQKVLTFRLWELQKLFHGPNPENYISDVQLSVGRPLWTIRSLYLLQNEDLCTIVPHRDRSYKSLLAWHTTIPQTPVGANNHANAELLRPDEVMRSDAALCSLLAKTVGARRLRALCFFIHVSPLIHLFFPAIFSRPSAYSTPVVMPTD